MTTTELDPFRHISFLERVDQIRTKYSADGVKTRELIEDIAKAIKAPCCWTRCVCSHTAVLSIGVWQSKCRETADFDIIDNKAVLTHKGEYEYEGQLDKVEAYLNKGLAGDFNEVNLATIKCKADIKHRQTRFEGDITAHALSVGELNTSLFLLEEGIINVLALPAMAAELPEYVGELLQTLRVDNANLKAIFQSKLLCQMLEAPKCVVASRNPTINMIQNELANMRRLYAKIEVLEQAEDTVNSLN